MATPTLVLHHLSASRSFRILWLLEELNVPYEIKKYTRVEGLFAPEELKKVSPLGKAPILQDGDVTLAESGAIVEYLIHKYGPQFNCPEEHYVQNVYFTHLAESTLGPTGSTKITWQVLPTKVPFVVRPILNAVKTKFLSARIDPELQTLTTIVEDQLAKAPAEFFVADRLTSADFMMHWCLAFFEDRLPALGPKTKAYVARMKERPAYKSAVEKGGE
ncbi:glutathione S-transferase-like protein [Auricularia subglabra TFB-10046 SS5]|nr:glutathione S-transferase-like protein [Auricularia subglabra TFB-10046 SS5]